MKSRKILFLGLALIGLGINVSRNKDRIRNRVRYVNKAATNRFMMKFAGASWSPVSFVRHVGRKSGKRYETPIITAPFPSGFVFALTYGPHVDWYRNVLAAGECGLRWQGREFTLEQPEPLAVEDGSQAFSEPIRTLLRAFRIEDFFWMRIREEVEIPGAMHAE